MGRRRAARVVVWIGFVVGRRRDGLVLVVVVVPEALGTTLVRLLPPRSLLRPVPVRACTGRSLLILLPIVSLAILVLLIRLVRRIRLFLLSLFLPHAGRTLLARASLHIFVLLVTRALLRQARVALVPSTRPGRPEAPRARPPGVIGAAPRRTRRERCLVVHVGAGEGFGRRAGRGERVGFREGRVHRWETDGSEWRKAIL